MPAGDMQQWKFWGTSMKEVHSNIRACEKQEHWQQVAYSTHHDALTQICFDCESIWTSMPPRQRIVETKAEG